MNDVEHVATRTLEQWEAITAALTPVIGQQGMSALYKRALVLSAADHPWLPAYRDDTSLAMELAALRSALLRQPVSQAAGAGEAMTSIFVALLVSLIGSRLTEQLLHDALPPARDNTTQPTLLP